MFAHYLLTAYRNFLKQKILTFINIFGLAIGLCVFILIFLFVEKELSYEKHWHNSDRIVRLNMHLRPNSLAPAIDNLTSYLVMPGLSQYFSNDIEYSARRVIRGTAVQIDEENHPGGLWLVEREFIDIFKFEELSGSLEQTLQNPNRIALSLNSALTYFGTDEVLGKTLSLVVPGVGLVDYIVTCVYRLPAGNTIQDFPTIALFDENAMTERIDSLNSWGPEGWFVMNYALLKPEASLSEMNRQMDNFKDQFVGPSVFADNFIFRLQKITDSYFKPTLREQGGDILQLGIFSVIAFLVLLVGSINFVTLTTANSINRGHEAGIRKVSGAKKSQVISQFHGESVCFTIIALIIALMLIELSLPFFTTLVDSEIQFDYFKFSNWVYLILLITIVGGLGGLYPAFILANSSPASMIKNNGFRSINSQLQNTVSLRNILLGFQFTISIFLLIVTFILFSQLSFYQRHDRGFNPENLITLNFPTAPRETRQGLQTTLMEQIKKIPGVVNITSSINQPNDTLNNLPSIPLSNDLIAETEIFSMGLFIDYDFFDVYQIPLLAGRTYKTNQDTPFNPSSNPGFKQKIIINRFAASSLGYPTPESAIGEEISFGIIIGVVENSQILSTLKPVNAEIYPLNPSLSSIITFRHQAGIESITLERVKLIWNEVIGEDQFQPKFVVQQLSQAFREEKNEGKLLLILSLLSIFVSALGLYALVAFSVKRQTKETGIRKVMGANHSSLLKGFLWQFMPPILYANIIAWPLALWAMLTWLQRFPYQINHILLFPLCMIATVIALIIASLTVYGTVTKSINKSPVLALRYE